MKKIFKAAAAFAAVGAVAFSGAGLAISPLLSEPRDSAAAVDDTNDDWLHAEGSRLYDMNGNEVWLTGANWFGMNCSENAPHGLYAADVDKFLSNVADRGINVIRFPISTELIVSWMNGDPNPVSSVQASYQPPVDQVGEDGTVTPAGTYGNINKDLAEADGKTLKNSEDIFDVIVAKCKQYGIKAFIDIHSPDANNSGHDYPLWYGKAGVTTEVWQDSLVWLADKYKNDDTILGYDLKNEPHGKREYSGTTCPDNIARWDDSDAENNWARAATNCANAILEVNPHALIFIEGVEQYPKTEKGYTYDTPDIWQASADVSPWYGAWWGGNLRGVRDYPIVPDSGTSQIVYSPHDYGPSVYAQTWFDKNFTEQTLLDDYWYDTWAYINEEEIAPLLIGEWGGHMDGTKNQQWMELLRDYMLKHHINHTFWCLNPNSGDTAGLLGYDFYQWDEDKYGMFEQALWQTQETGKYIGLDHQRPLGVNGTGLSLNEYYSSYSETEGSNIDGGTKGSGSVVTTSPATPTQPATTVVTTKAPVATTAAPDGSVLYGDANCDGTIDIADATMILQYIGNGDKYKISEAGKKNADCCDPGSGITALDALAVQKLDAKVIKELPELTQ
ncbi:MAG: cellulase family glycosylhydrolase [Alistipes sp.]|nr:cellulase family glycosylhydrolase [Alistipes sp.]